MKPSHFSNELLLVIRKKSVQGKQKKDYDERFKTVKSKRFMPGDTVMLLDNTSRGLSEKNIGPFIIIDTADSNGPIRSLLNGKEKHVHYNCLKPFELDLDQSGRSIMDISKNFREITLKPKKKLSII